MSLQRFLQSLLDQHIELELPKVTSLGLANEQIEVDLFTLTFIPLSGDRDSSSKSRGAPPKSRSIQVSLDH